MKKPAFIILESAQSEYTVAVNSSDLKRVVTSPNCMEVFSSQHDLELEDITAEEQSKFEKSIRSRYNIVRVGEQIALETTKDAYTAILCIESSSQKTFIWPNALSTLTASGDKLTVGIFGVDQPIEHKLSHPATVQRVTEMFKLLNIH